IARMGSALETIGRAAAIAATLPATILTPVAIVFALAIRCAVLVGSPISPHETHYLSDARRVREAGSIAALHGSVHGWLAALGYAHVLDRWPAAGERELRWIQLGFSMASLGLVYAIGREAASPRVGAAAALVHALTPSAVNYGASAEPYAAHLFLVTA